MRTTGFEGIVATRVDSCRHCQRKRGVLVYGYVTSTLLIYTGVYLGYITGPPPGPGPIGQGS
jgi:hypothetical protein